MTSEEVVEAYKDGAWLVWDNLPSLGRCCLVRLSDRNDFDRSSDEFLWWIRNDNGRFGGVAHRDDLRPATAKDMLKLSE